MGPAPLAHPPRPLCRAVAGGYGRPGRFAVCGRGGFCLPRGVDGAVFFGTALCHPGGVHGSASRTGGGVGGDFAGAPRRARAGRGGGAGEIAGFVGDQLRGRHRFHPRVARGRAVGAARTGSAAEPFFRPPVPRRGDAGLCRAHGGEPGFGERGHDEQVQRRRGDEPAEDDDGHRALDFAAGFAAAHSQRQQPEGGH
jgi:hypothetical protein